jgi:hypothetical protein
MSDTTANTNAMSGGGGGGGGDAPPPPKPPAPEKSNVKILSKEDKKKIKCQYGKLCRYDPCDYLHSSTHVPYVPVVEEHSGPKMCNYDKKCIITDCKFKHSDGYIPHPNERCKHGENCDFNDDDVPKNEKCRRSHPNDPWWNDLPEVKMFTSGATRGGFNGTPRGAPRGGYRGGFMGAPRGAPRGGSRGGFIGASRGGASNGAAGGTNAEDD